jgi:hypothetical protein
VAQYLRSTEKGEETRDVVYNSVRLNKSEGPTLRCTNITTIFPRISKTVLRKPAKVEGLLEREGGGKNLYSFSAQCLKSMILKMY